MGERRTCARETLKVTSAVSFEPLLPEDGIFHFPLDSTTIMGNVSHLYFGSSRPEEEFARKQQVKLEKLLVKVGLVAPGHSLATLMEELKAGAPEAVGSSKAGYILRIRLYIHPRQKQVGCSTEVLLMLSIFLRGHGLKISQASHLWCSVRQLRLQIGLTRLLLLERRATSEGKAVEVKQLPKPIRMLLDREESKDLAPVNGLSINWEVESTM